MSIHRYSPVVEIDESAIARYAESGGSIARRSLVTIDIQLNDDADKPGFDDYMEYLGSKFVSTDPTGMTYAPFEAGIVTLDATPTPVLRIPTQDNTSYLVRAQMVARRPSSGVSGAWAFDGAFRRDVGAGSLVQIGATVSLTLLTQNPLWLAGFDLDVSTGDILLVGTGVAGATINWYTGALVTQAS